MVATSETSKRIELTLTLPYWFGSIWPWSFLIVSVTALVAIMLRDGLASLLSPVEVQVISLSNIIVVLLATTVGVLSLWWE